MSVSRQPRGEASAGLPPTAFIAFIQNHDQIGNRAFGERITAIASPEAVRAIARCTCSRRRYRCCSWARNGPPAALPVLLRFRRRSRRRRAQGAAQGVRQVPGVQGREVRERIPDPQAKATFASAKLRWDETATEPHAGWLEWYRGLLATRRAGIVPLLPDIGGNAARFEIIGEEAVLVRWRLGGGEELALAANLSATPWEGFPAASGRVLWQEGDVIGGRFGPWAVRWSIDQA